MLYKPAPYLKCTRPIEWEKEILSLKKYKDSPEPPYYYYSFLQLPQVHAINPEKGERVSLLARQRNTIITAKVTPHTTTAESKVDIPLLYSYGLNVHVLVFIV